MVIDVVMLRGGESRGAIRWGQRPERSQFAVFVLVVTFTWLMGLMGYVRSGLRQHWHVYGVVRDQSVDAFTPTLGFATKVVSVTVLLFFVLIGLVFWISSLHDRPDFAVRKRVREGDEVSPELAVANPGHHQTSTP